MVSNRVGCSGAFVFLSVEIGELLLDVNSRELSCIQKEFLLSNRKSGGKVLQRGIGKRKN